MAITDPDTKLEIRKADLGFTAVVLGILVVTAMFIVIIVKVGASTNLTTIATSFTAVIGTLVAAYFGVQKGSEGKDKAERQRDKASDERDKYKNFGIRFKTAYGAVKPGASLPESFEAVENDFDSYMSNHP